MAKGGLPSSKIGGLLNPNLESWITLKPDLVIMQETSHRLRQHAKNLGIPILLVNMGQLATIFDSIRNIGNTLRIAGAADRLIARLQTDIQNIENKLTGLQKNQCC